MKKIVLILLATVNMYAAIGCCRQNLYDIETGERADPVLVAVPDCLCKCSDYVDYQGYCQQCKHYGSPDRAVYREYEPTYGIGLMKMYKKLS